MKYEIVIIGDTNDADYVTTIATITEETLEKIKPLIKAIKESNCDYNWDASEYAENDCREVYAEFGEEVLDLFEDLVPTGEQCIGVHGIDRIDVYPVPKKERLL